MQLLARWTPLLAASGDAALFHDLSNRRDAMLRGLERPRTKSEPLLQRFAKST
jgi:hypothetical protein